MNKLQTTLFDSRTGISTSLADAVTTSQPLSGGLFTPIATQMPHFDARELQVMASMSYSELAFAVLRKFNWGITPDDLQHIIRESYGSQWHRPQEITPVQKIGEKLYSLHLGYGPTFAFKNIALEFLPRLLSRLTRSRIVHVLGASSGDTINAAHHGVRGTNIKSLFMLPNTGPSAVQRLQATHGIVGNKNALTILADVPFDPLQDIVKQVNTPEHAQLKEKY